MLHSIPTEKLGPFGEGMVGAVQACVHCGFCLTACPTYGELGQEMDTPRGRIVLIKRVLEGDLPWESAQPHIDRCLGCLACEPACPSGVHYRELITPFRALLQSRRLSTPAEKLKRAILTRILPHPARFRFAVTVGRAAMRLLWLTPKSLKVMLDLLPARLPPKQNWNEFTPAHGRRRARVALLTGCVQSVLEPDINSATIEVLSRNGVEVITPRRQACCGGLAWHTGDLAVAQRLARQNLAAFPKDIDAVVTNAAGCGSTLQEYALILRGKPDERAADRFQKGVVDVSVFLDRLEVRPPEGRVAAQRIAYHDACHLAHAQRVTAEPRRLLRSIPGIELLELPSALCCGSAGTYNLDQPAIAASLGKTKANEIVDTSAQLVVSGNIGCINQLRIHLSRLGAPIPVRHTMQLLRDAYRAEQTG
jgi:glycolate oxidase iron-sulfur subunit